MNEGVMARRKVRARRRRGFTLVEVLAALVVFGIAMMALVEGLAGASRIQANLENEYRAAMLAENVLEEIIYSQRYELGRDEGEFEGENSGYQWTTEIEETQTVRLLSVAVTVSWERPQAGEYRLATLMMEGADALE